MKKWVMFVCLFLSLAWTAFIFSRSAKSASESMQESGAVLGLVSQILGFFGVQKMPSNHLIRKLGHFLEYAILAFPTFFAARLLPLSGAPVFVLIYGAFVACADEFLVQNSAVGRGPLFSDVVIDLAGVLTAVIFLQLCIRYLQRSRQERFQK